MWTTALKYLAILFLKKRMGLAKANFFNKPSTNSGDSNNIKLNRLKENIAAMAESRAAIFKQNFNHEVKRVVNSLFGFMLILLAAMFSLLTGLMWLFATAWVSPNRNLVLGSAMLLPILIAVGIYFFIRHSWHKQPILHQSIVQIESDWQAFKAALDGTAQNIAEPSDEAHK
jgi:uncharacterized membrane protein YqjE